MIGDHTRELIWKRIERETREQCEALTLALEATPLQVGQEVAWTFHGHLGTTDHFSPVHRVAEPDGETRETLCGETIPPAARRIAVDGLWRKMLGPCKSCQIAHLASVTVAESHASRSAA